MSLWTNVDEAAGKPKHLNTADKAKTFGVSLAEAQTPDNIAKGLNTPGWVQHVTYTDAQGNTRNKSVVLAAFSTLTGDASDDATVVDPVITIGTDVLAASVTSPDSGVFTVAASIDNGGVLTYAWEVSTDSGSTWAAVVDAVDGAATLTVLSTDAEYVTGNQFRVTVSSTGAASVTSAEVALTIA